MSEREMVIELLNKSIDALEQAAKIEQRVSRSKKQNDFYSTLLAQLIWLRESECAVLKQYLT